MLIVFGLPLSAFELFSNEIPISLGKTRVWRMAFDAGFREKVLKKNKKGGIAPASWRRRKRLAAVTHAPLATSIFETSVVKIGVDSAADPCQASRGRISGDHLIASMNNFLSQAPAQSKGIYLERRKSIIF
jgi:hypothetical protein